MHPLLFSITIFFAAAALAQEPAAEGAPPESVAPEAPPEPPADPDTANATTVEVKLQILAKGNGRPIARAEVKIGLTKFYSEPNGELTISVPSTEGKILIERPGYARKFVDFATLRESPNYKVYLTPDTPDDDVVIITADKRPEVSRKIITVEETKRIAPGGDPAQITKLMPGVVTQTFSPEVVIRGSGPLDSRYYVDDFQVPFIFHSIGGFSVMPDQLISEVEFSSGGFGAQYGNATGGIIVLRTTDKIPEYRKSEYRFNVPFYVTAYDERPLGDDASLAVSFRHSLTEFIIPRFIPEEADLTIIPTFSDVHLRYLKKTDSGHFKLTTIGSRDGMLLSAPFEGAGSEEDGKAKVEFHNDFAVLGVEYLRLLGEGWSAKTSPSISYATLGFNIFDDSLDGKTLTFGAFSEVRQRLDKGRYMYIGIDPQIVYADFNVTAPQPVMDDPFFDFEDAPRYTYDDSVTAGTFATWIAYDVGLGSMTLTPGLRAFYTQQLSETAVDPRLSWRMPLTEEHMLKAAVGQYSIAPDYVESTKEFGNPDLGFEKSNHYIGGVESKWSERWSTEFQVFRKKTYNLILSHPSTRYGDEGTRLTDGFEVFLRRNLTEKFFGWLAYTYSKSEERKSDQSPWYLSSYDQTHILNIAGSYKFTAVWDMGLRFKLNSGNTYSPVTDSVYNASLDKYQPIYDTAHPNSERLPTDHTIDLFWTYEDLSNTYKISYRFGVQYIALAKRVTNVSYNNDYTEKKMQSNQLPPIPFIEVRGEF